MRQRVKMKPSQRPSIDWCHWDSDRHYITVRLRYLLGSLSGFNQVPLLQTLEAVLEDTALWLQEESITRRGERRFESNAQLSHNP